MFFHKKDSSPHFVELEGTEWMSTYCGTFVKGGISRSNNCKSCSTWCQRNTIYLQWISHARIPLKNREHCLHQWQWRGWMSMCEQCHRILSPLLPVCRILLGCIVMLCTAASGSVTDIPDNNTSHITEECRTASLGARQQPAGEGGCHCYRLIDHNVSDWISIEKLSEI